ncbi:MAG: methyltransferase domain-containing protein [Candidatus Heimdallarchaeota archaeon]|nr:methyltransferase domain-containing protein [Candidatus Heimdallarchaeota archaeon]
MGLMNLRKYYEQRAEEYEEIYNRDDPAQQAEKRKLANKLRTFLRDRKVLEVACGTGYWTQFLSETAQSILATDIGEKVIALAKKKSYNCSVSFQIENAYDLTFKSNSFTGAVAIFWFSHMPKERIDAFIKEFHRTLQPGARVFIADNVYVQGLGGQLVTKPNDENTYKHRRLKDKSEFLILKNYFSSDAIVEIFRRHIPSFSKNNVFFGKYYWWVFYELPRNILLFSLK